MFVVIKLLEVLIQIVGFPGDHLLQLWSTEQASVCFGTPCVNLYLNSLHRTDR